MSEENRNNEKEWNANLEVKNTISDPGQLLITSVFLID